MSRALAPLGQLCLKIGSGATPRGGSEAYKRDGIALVRSMNVRMGIFDRSGLAFIDDEQAQGLSNVALEPNDVLLNITGASVARSCLLDNSILPARVNQHVCILRPDPQRLDHRYLMRFLTSEQTQGELLRIAGAGATREAITKGEIQKLGVPLPPLSEQKRIAAILDAADALRAKRREALAQLDTLLQSTFLDMFGDPVTNPMGWESTALGELITAGPQNGLYKPSKDYGSGIRILRIDGFYDGAIRDLGDLKRVRVSSNEIALYGLSESDIVVNRVNSRSHLGKCALVPRLSEPVVFESNMMRLRLDGKRILPRFATQFLQTGYVKSQILRACKDAVNQSSINQSDVKAFSILVPPLDLQRLFTTIVASIEAQKASQRAHLAELDTLFASLQSRAFRGEL